MTTLADFFAILALSVQALVVIGVIVRVILTRHPPGSSFAWILLTIILPYIGFILYLSLGERPLGRMRARKLKKMFRPWKKKIIAKQTRSRPPVKHKRHADLINLATTLSGLPFAHASNIKLEADARTAFLDMIADIDGAESSIEMEFYIWNEDGVVSDVASRLIAAAGRGVSIRILVDDFGSRPFIGSDSFKRMKHAGIQIESALPLKFLNIFGIQRTDLRLHRKTIVIDNKIAYTGSLNMIDPSAYMKAAKTGDWVDAMVRFEGPAVLALQAVWMFDWTLQGKHPSSEALDKLAGEAGTPYGNMNIIPSDPCDDFNVNQLMLIEAIHQAEKSIVVTTPYFVPSEATVIALINAARKGVRVRIIIPHKSDSKMVGYASRRYFDDMLMNNIEILLYKTGLLHTKSILIDDEYSLFGTLNIDNRSMHLNFELMLQIFDEGFNSELRKLLDEYAQNSQKVTIGRWRRRPLSQKFLEGACHLLSPLL